VKIKGNEKYEFYSIQLLLIQPDPTHVHLCRECSYIIFLRVWRIGSDRQSFLSELYVYLIDEMHVGLNKVLSVEDERPTPPPVTSSAQLKHFAREAEVNGNMDQAATFYQEVPATNVASTIHRA